MGWGVTQSSVGVIGDQGPESTKLPGFLKERGFGVSRWPTLIGAPQLSGVQLAILVFADEFSVQETIEWLDGVRKVDGNRLIIVLTAKPAEFAGTRGANVIVLVRPVLAWHLVDLIRHHAQRAVGGSA